MKWLLILLLHLPGAGEPVPLTILNSPDQPWHETEAECRAMEPAVYDHVLAGPGVTLEAVCATLGPHIPRLKPVAAR